MFRCSTQTFLLIIQTSFGWTLGVVLIFPCTADHLHDAQRQWLQSPIKLPDAIDPHKAIHDFRTAGKGNRSVYFLGISSSALESWRNFTPN